MCVWMPTAHQSDFAVAAFCGIPDIHARVFVCLHLALLPVNEKPPSCKPPHNCPVVLSIDLATFVARKES